MKLYHLVIKDVLRRKKRVLYSTVGIVIATMTCIGILTIANAGEARIYAQLEKYGANLNVIPAISNIDVSLGELNLGTITVGENYIAEDKVSLIREITDREIRESLDIEGNYPIATVAPKLYVGTTVNGASIVVIGIEPQEESALKPWWIVKTGNYLDDGFQAVIGAHAAELLGFSPGDNIKINETEFSITGVMQEVGSQEDFQVYIPLKIAQEVFGKEGKISSVDVRALCTGCPVEMIADKINHTVTGVRALAVKQVAESEIGLMQKVNNLMIALAGITLLIGIFGVVNTMMTSVNERLKDIGIMRAVGASRGQIIRAFIYEALIIGIIGGMVGYVFGTLIAFAAGPLVFEGATVRIFPAYLPLSIALAVIVAVISTAYPAYRATKIKVSDSFRSL